MGLYRDDFEQAQLMLGRKVIVVDKHESDSYDQSKSVVYWEVDNLLVGEIAELLKSWTLH